MSVSYTDVDECSFDTVICKNNGTCLNWEGSYNCSCADGFEGENCENEGVSSVYQTYYMSAINLKLRI